MKVSKATLRTGVNPCSHVFLPRTVTVRQAGLILLRRYHSALAKTVSGGTRED